MILFNKPFTIENEFKYIEDAINDQGILCGDGFYTKIFINLFFGGNQIMKLQILW